LDIIGLMELSERLSKVTEAQLGCSSLMFSIADLCPKRDCSARCAAIGDGAVVTILFLQIATDYRIGISVVDCPGELPAGSGPI
jgi:hypothetical protein